jgi:bla regulator protein blaR1
VRALAVAILISNGVFAQTPAFDVASVKPASSGARGSTFQFIPGGGLRVGNGTLKGMIEMAYDVRDFQISGGPGWVDSDRYNVDAKVIADDPSAGAAMTPARIQETRRRLQTLLAARFQLQVRRTTKELPILALEPAKNGPKLAAAEAKGGNIGIRAACGLMEGNRSTLANLVYALSRELARPVRDRTNLAGIYNFRLQWTPDAGPCPDAAEGHDFPDLFTALKEQLGLRLESARGPLEVILIDRAEKPSQN